MTCPDGPHPGLREPLPGEDLLWKATLMMRLAAPDDTRVVAVTEALAPYAWRTLTPEAVSRRAPAAVDPHRIHGAPGIARQDERIKVLSDFLAECPWRSLTAAGLSRRLVSVLDAWRQESQWLEIRLHWTQDGV
ncbi:hypothetical protein ABZ445_20145 [Streptomyces chartreusis]|uniref:hypothetical protein n=1 Tax=Streptomyces chartreusis TaxID=1969 RepID=UPI0033C7F3C6